MRKTLVIHGGMHKTGSSVIQRTLYANRELLLGQGILYPKTGLIHDSQIGHRHYGFMKALENSAKSSDVYRQFNQEVDESGCNVIIVSHEDILSPRKSILDGVRLLTESYDVKLICYFRDPIQYFNAKYKEWVRRQKFAGEPGDFVIEHLDYLAWDKLLIPWFALLPKNNVVIRKYHRNTLINQSSIDDFCEALGSHWDINIKALLSDLSGSNNVGLSNNETLLALMKNKYFSNKFDSEISHSKYLDLMANIKSEKKEGLVLSKEVARQIKAKNWHARHYIQKKSSIEFDIPPIDELVFDNSFNDEELRVEYKRAIADVLSASSSLSNH
ncbi:MAG: hypothetical protein ACI9UT_001485 [Flavobacteriales bacterium]|jgi:hypothetical protein